VANSNFSLGVEQIQNGSVIVDNYKMIFVKLQDMAIDGRYQFVPFIFGGDFTYTATNSSGDVYLVSGNFDYSANSIGLYNCQRTFLRDGEKQTATTPSIIAIYGVK
jgi:hypothetical protein